MNDFDLVHVATNDLYWNLRFLFLKDFLFFSDRFEFLDLGPLELNSFQMFISVKLVLLNNGYGRLCDETSDL